MTKDDFDSLREGDVVRCTWGRLAVEVRLIARNATWECIVVRSGLGRYPVGCSWKVGFDEYALYERVGAGSIAVHAVLAGPSKETSHWNTTCSGCGSRGNMGFLFFECEAKCARPGDTNAR